MTVQMWQDSGDAEYPAEMNRCGFEHLALRAEAVEDGIPVVTAKEFERWTRANGEYYPNGIAEVVPWNDDGFMVCAMPWHSADEVSVWKSTGERNAAGDLLYELTDWGTWMEYKK